MKNPDGDRYVGDTCQIELVGSALLIVHSIGNMASIGAERLHGLRRFNGNDQFCPEVQKDTRKSTRPGAKIKNGCAVYSPEIEQRGGNVLQALDRAIPPGSRLGKARPLFAEIADRSVAEIHAPITPDTGLPTGAMAARRKVSLCSFRAQVRDRGTHG